MSTQAALAPQDNAQGDVRKMPLFFAHAKDYTDEGAFERRLKVRPEHFARFTQDRKAGTGCESSLLQRLVGVLTCWSSLRIRVPAFTGQHDPHESSCTGESAWAAAHGGVADDHPGERPRRCVGAHQG